MGVRQNKVAVQDLVVGAFVSDLDRPWHETPFPIQGFYIRNQDEIRSLTSYCKWVMVDVAETRDTSEYEASKAPIFTRRSAKRVDEDIVQLPPIQVRNRKAYPLSASLKKEVRHSQRVLLDVDKALKQVERQLRAGDSPDFGPLSRVAKGMAGSVIRNPDAMLWVARLRQHDDYSYRHSLNAAVWSLVCGRHMGLDSVALTNLALGTLLCHVGKLDLSVELVRNETMLGAEAYAEFRTYVARGVHRLQQADMPRAVINVVQYHRERHNGSGFPTRVRGDRIPLLAKIAGLVDYYETLVEPRQEQTPMTPAQAVAHLYELRNIEFQEDLVEHFIQSIGVYPTGTLVQLSNGQRGAVVSNSRGRRLWPHVMVMTDTEQKPLRAAQVVNLAEFNEGRESSEVLSVSNCLPFGAEGLDPRHFEVTGASSRWSWRHLIG
ncbi:HD-GYP domain-containing protein [Marinobacter fonticola]|uniref:HD-GYP domain-containing protein n=1 Tax=Marinobacter fonticola TaxID=2603215 RepID=UPI0011E73FDA|nr:HD-GYP domain-containing protein [Marinobacter fonticola]